MTEYLFKLFGEMLANYGKVPEILPLLPDEFAALSEELGAQGGSSSGFGATWIKLYCKGGGVTVIERKPPAMLWFSDISEPETFPEHEPPKKKHPLYD